MKNDIPGVKKLTKATYPENNQMLKVVYFQIRVMCFLEKKYLELLFVKYIIYNAPC